MYKRWMMLLLFSCLWVASLLAQSTTWQIMDVDGSQRQVHYLSHQADPQHAIFQLEMNGVPYSVETDRGELQRVQVFGGGGQLLVLIESDSQGLVTMANGSGFQTVSPAADLADQPQLAEYFDPDALFLAQASTLDFVEQQLGIANQPPIPPELIELMQAADNNQVPTGLLTDTLGIHAQLNPQAEALFQLQQVEPQMEVVWSPTASVPSYLSGRLSQGSNLPPYQIAWNFMDSYGDLYYMQQPQTNLRIDGDRSVIQDQESGWSHVWYDQMVGEYRVPGHQLHVAIDGEGVIRGVNGRYQPGLDAANFPAQPTIPENAVADIIRNDLNLSGNFSDYKIPELQISLATGNARAVWATEVFADGMDAAYTYHIDVTSGEVVHKQSEEIHITGTSPQVGTGRDNYGNTFGLNAARRWDSSYSSTWVGDYFLRDMTRDANIHGYDLEGAGTWQSVYCEDSGNTFTGTSQRAEAEGHRNMGTVLDYFDSVHGRDSYDDSDGNVYLGYHALIKGSSNNASSIGSGRFKFGDGSSSRNPYTTLDIVAHEFGHAMLSAEGISYSGAETQAIHESLSDTFACFVEEHAGNASGASNFEIGEELASSFNIRDLSNPGSNHNHYFDFDSTANAHANANITNYAAYLIWNGGTHPESGVTVTGQGVTDTRRIYYRAVKRHLSDGASFYDLRQALSTAAEELFGSSSNERFAVKEAFNAIGVTTHKFSFINWANDFDSWTSSSGAITFGTATAIPGAGYTAYALEDGSAAPSSSTSQLGIRGGSGSYSWTRGEFMMTMGENKSATTPHFRASVGFRETWLIPIGYSYHAMVFACFAPADGGSSFLTYSEIRMDGAMTEMNEDLRSWAEEPGTFYLTVMNWGSPMAGPAIFNKCNIGYE